MFMTLAYKLANNEIRRLIDEDVYRYLKWDNVNDKSDLLRFKLCLKKRDFRPVFFYRIKDANVVVRMIARIGKLYNHCYNTVEIGGKIQGGLYISHSFSVVIPKSAGKNLRVGPGVVIGRTNAGYPVIGNNVYIAANSAVIGQITIGNNVIIGAGTVVTKDIPDNSVVVGNPARVIREICETDMNEIK